MMMMLELLLVYLIASSVTNRLRGDRRSAGVGGERYDSSDGENSRSGVRARLRP